MDALSRNPLLDGTDKPLELGTQILQICNDPYMEIGELEPDDSVPQGDEFSQDQRKDPSLKIRTEYLEKRLLPDNDKDAKQVVAKSYHFVNFLDGVLYLWTLVKEGCCI